MSEFELWDAELKHQSKRRLRLLDRACKKTGAMVVHQYEWKLFKYKQQWRNPLQLKIQVPKGKRWEFILEARLWLSPAGERISVSDLIKPETWTRLRYVPLRGNHDNMTIRRNYRLHPAGAEYIGDYKPELNGGYEIFKGAEVVCAVLGGDLDVLGINAEEK